MVDHNNPRTRSDVMHKHRVGKGQILNSNVALSASSRALIQEPNSNMYPLKSIKIA